MVRARLDSHYIPDGGLGTRATLRHMRRLAREGGAACFLLHRLASHILTVTETDTGAAWEARAWLAAHVAFQSDPPGRESVKAPALMMREVEAYGRSAGDCDDVATLGAALGHALGFRPFFVVVGFEAGGPYHHVYTYLPTSAGPVDLDTTAPAQELPGLTIHRRQEMEA